MTHFGCQLHPKATKIRVDAARSFDCCLHMRQYIIPPNMIHKVGLLEESRWLFSRATDQQRSSRFMQAMGKSFDCMETCCIQRSHVAQTENDNRIEFIQIPGRFHQLFCRAEQKRPVDSVDRDVVGNLVQLKAVRSPVVPVSDTV